MDFNNRLKGTITQGIIEALLKDAGYNIVPLGIEEIIREVQTLTSSEYIKLNLSQTLRGLPDYFVSEPNLKKTFLVEVKYRSRWNETTKASLKTSIENQIKQWQPLYLILFLGEKARDNETPASYLGVLRLEFRDNSIGSVTKSYEADLTNNTTIEKEYFRRWDDITWDSFKRLHDIFDLVSSRIDDNTITKSVELVKNLNPILINS